MVSCCICASVIKPSMIELLMLTLCLGGIYSKDDYRLPLEVIPESYEMFLVPYLDEQHSRFSSFDGTVHITVKARQNATTVTLHALNLEIKNITSPSLSIKGYSQKKENDFLIIELKQQIFNSSVHNISIQFIGQLENYESGFLKSAINTTEGKRQWIAGTKFEATFARRAFPCFDEPALKATFHIRIAPPLGYHALSNMPVETITEPDSKYENRSWYKFQPSAIMSTYLVAFVVSTYANITKGNFTIYGGANDIEGGRYALSVSPRVLSTLEDLTGIKYPLPKLDQVAIYGYPPTAMENWGLIIYQYNVLMPITSSSEEHMHTLSTLQHEFSHNWFGNLVSPEWWSYLWLNEAFANYFGSFLTQMVDPAFVDELVLNQPHTMDVEMGIMSRPLTSEVKNSTEIKKLFDIITYRKGGCIIRSIHRFLTNSTFFKGLQIYLKKHMYSSVTPDDLFAALQEAATEDKALPQNLNVKDILDTWTLQASFPQVTVERNYEAGTAAITQSPVKMTCNCSGDERWYVPITYTTRKERDFNRTEPRTWLTPEKDHKVILEGLDKDDWLIVNLQDSGYYKVVYDERNWNLILTGLKQTDFDGIHPVNRRQLLHEAGTKKKPTHLWYNMLQVLKEDDDPSVQKNILDNVRRVHNRLRSSDRLSYAKKFFKPVVEKMQFRSDKGSILDDIEDWNLALTSSINDQQFRHAEKSAEFEESDGRPAAWCSRVHWHPSAWDVAWRRYEQAASVKERRDALAALGCARDAERLLSAAVADAGEGERVLERDRVAALVAPCGSDTRRAVGGGGAEACSQAVLFVAKNANRIRRMLADPDDFLTLVRSLASKIQTEEQYSMLQFAAMEKENVGMRHSSPLSIDVWRNVLVTARHHVQKADEEADNLVSWFQQNSATYDIK